MFRHRKYNYLPCGCSAMLRLNYSWSERTLRITTLHEKHTGHAVSAQAYKEFVEKSKRFGARQNSANGIRRFSAPLSSTAFANCQTLEAILNHNSSPLSDKENDPAAAEKSVEANEEKVEPSSSPRTDEECFLIIHVVMQSLCDDLLETEDAELDEKLAQLAALHSQWQMTHLYGEKVSVLSYICHNSGGQLLKRRQSMSRHRKYNYLPCGCSAMLRLNYSWSERTLRITTLHEKHTGHAVSAQAYKEFLEKSKRFRSRQNPANDTRRFSAPLPHTALTSCHTLEALLNPNDSPLSDKENDPATVESAAEDSVVIEDGVEANEEKVELSSSPRTDEERFQIIHAVLQGLCDNLLESEDAELDEKLAQLATLHSQWREMNL
ncbi:hypothetical protein T09_10567 [Trichinella sp. T9]|nr:hypothetical protein T09_10567 [Trichinella sp. T9]